MIRQKCEFFLEKKTTIHIQKTNGQFYNGLILEINNDFIILLDKKVGEVPIYFSEITKLEPYKEREGENENL